jgi:hypothetical protein
MPPTQDRARRGVYFQQRHSSARLQHSCGFGQDSCNRDEVSQREPRYHHRCHGIRERHTAGIGLDKQCPDTPPSRPGEHIAGEINADYSRAGLRGEFAEVAGPARQINDNIL